MRSAAEVVDAVPGAQAELLAVDNLDDLPLQHEDQFLAGMLDGFGTVAGRDVEDEGGQLVAGKLGPDLLVDDRGARERKALPLAGAGHAVGLPRRGDEMVDPDVERGRNLGQGAERRHRVVTFNLAEIAHRDTTCVAQLLQGHGQDRKSTRLNSSHVKISYAV